MGICPCAAELADISKTDFIEILSNHNIEWTDYIDVGVLNREDVIEQMRASFPYLHEQYGVSKIRLFGSYARNEQTNTSDIDILITLDKPIGLEFISIKGYLEDKLGNKVDLVTIDALKPPIRDQILKEVIYIGRCVKSSQYRVLFFRKGPPSPYR